MYIWCCMHECTSGVVCMWYCVQVVQVALCADGVVSMSCMWRYVHVMSVVLCTCGIMYTLYSGAMYMWHCVHVCRWCRVHVMMCTRCVGGPLYMWYWCTCGVECMSSMLCSGHVTLCMCLV